MGNLLERGWPEPTMPKVSFCRMPQITTWNFTLCTNRTSREKEKVIFISQFKVRWPPPQGQQIIRRANQERRHHKHNPSLPLRGGTNTHVHNKLQRRKHFPRVWDRVMKLQQEAKITDLKTLVHTATASALPPSSGRRNIHFPFLHSYSSQGAVGGLTLGRHHSKGSQPLGSQKYLSRQFE